MVVSTANDCVDRIISRRLKNRAGKKIMTDMDKILVLWKCLWDVIRRCRTMASYKKNLQTCQGIQINGYVFKAIFYCKHDPIT